MSKLDQIKALGAAKAASHKSSDGGVESRHAVSAGVAPSPEAKKKRAPRGTFDRTAYQRELMRKRRQKEKLSGS
jgi:hypothetical protein